MGKILIIKYRLFLSITTILALVSYGIIMSNRLTISEIKTINPQGESRQVLNPFRSDSSGPSGYYKYVVDLENTLFFSGELQLIPDDCLENVMINGHSFFVQSLCKKGHRNNCDTKNGLYLDLGKHLDSNTSNRLIFTIFNHQGPYGIRIIDTTFYLKYVVFIILLWVLVVLNWKFIFAQITTFFKSFFLRKRRLVLSLIILYISFAIIIYFFTHINMQEYVTWSFIILLISSISFVVFDSLWFNLLYKEINYILLGSLVIYTIFLALVPFYTYTYDVDGHLDYIGYIVRFDHIPLASGGWVFYHPSFYYRCCAMFYKLVTYFYTLDLLSFTKIFQAFSLSIFLLYSYFSIRSIDLLFRWFKKDLLNERQLKLAYFLCIGLFLSWPSNAITSIRIGNDSMFSMFCAVSFYYLLRWYELRKLHYLFFSLIAAALCVWTKTNGLILFGLIGALIFATSIKEYILFRKKDQVLPLIAIFSIVFVSTVYFSFQSKFQDALSDPNARLVVGNANTLGSAFIVGKGPSNFLTLDLIKFIKTPFTHALEADSGREYFWYYLFKTSMFGEFNWGRGTIPFAKVESAMFLLLLIVFFIGFSSFWKRKESLPFILSLTLFLTAMILFRISYPFSSSGDFRYIYPALLPFFVMVATAVLNSKRIVIRIGASTIIFVFILSSFFFQLATIIELLGDKNHP